MKDRLDVELFGRRPPRARLSADPLALRGGQGMRGNRAPQKSIEADSRTVRGEPRRR